MNLSQYMIKEFNIFLTPEQLKEIKRLAKQPDKVSEDYIMCVDFWLKEFHEGWDYQAMHGKSMKSIIVKIKKRLKDYNKHITDKSVYDTFVYICNNLPDFYSDKDLNVINGGFNTIIEQIQNGRNRKNNTKVSTDRLASIYANKLGEK